MGTSVILPAVRGTALASNLCSSFPHSDTSPASALSAECLRWTACLGLSGRQGQPFGPSAYAFSPVLKRIGSQRAASAPPVNSFLKLIGCQAQSIHCPQEHVSMTNLRGRVRAFPHSLPLRGRTTVMCRCGQIKCTCWIAIPRSISVSLLRVVASWDSSRGQHWFVLVIYFIF